MAQRTGVPSGTVTWSDGTLFNGICWIGLKNMTSGGINWPMFTLAHISPAPQYPIWTPIRIQDGVYSNTESVTYNGDLNPPNTQYVALYQDSSGKTVGSLSAAFTVSASTFSIPAVTLTVPTVGGNPSSN